MNAVSLETHVYIYSNSLDTIIAPISFVGIGGEQFGCALHVALKKNLYRVAQVVGVVGVVGVVRSWGGWWGRKRH